MLNVVKETGTAVVVANQFPELQTLTSKALTRKEMVKHYPELEKHPQPNLWLEKKYAKLVNDDVLYVTADIEEVNLLPVLDKEVKTRTVTTLQSINPVLIPTTKLMGLAEAQATSHFIARKNQAKAIARIAQDDFDTRKNNLVNWVYRNITKNLPNLIDDLVSFNHKRFQIIGKDAATITDYDGIGLFGSSLRQVHLVNITFEQAYISKKEDQSKLSHYIGDLFHRGEYMNLCYLCSKHEYFSENQSGDWYCEAYNRLILNISNVADIELLTGIERYSLPEELQNYGVTSSGVNTILNLHDPMDSISNPWNKLDFNFSLPISKKALNERRKQLGLGKVTSEHYANVWDRNEVGEKLRSALYYNIYGDLRGDARTGNPMVSELPVTPWLSNVPKYFNFKK
ncbi:MAG: hypothetical protein HAW67_00150 [Endozoicomonadaceae bacterium]|nr:hypothetical protein [Endozoicomonadaceae bacterium]